MSDPNQVEGDHPVERPARKTREQTLYDYEVARARRRFDLILGTSISLVIGFFVFAALLPAWQHHSYPAAHSARVERESRQRQIEQAVRDAAVAERAALPPGATAFEPASRASAAD